MDDSVRWSLKVSRQTDQELREYLGQTGSRSGDLSRFIEQAVRARLSKVVRPRKTKALAAADARFAEALRDVRRRARNLTRAQVGKLAIEAVAYARKRR